jgi:hypothetical protein
MFFLTLSETLNDSVNLGALNLTVFRCTLVSRVNQLLSSAQKAPGAPRRSTFDATSGKPTKPPAGSLGKFRSRWGMVASVRQQVVSANRI